MQKGHQNPGSPEGKLLVFALYNQERLPDVMYAKLEAVAGKIDFKGRPVSFNVSEYYRSEFGSGLYRHILSFEGLTDPAELPRIKHRMHDLELKFKTGEHRSVNLDSGYLDSDKLVLGSFKRGKYKIYQGEGVYADMLMEYAKGSFKALPWAFEDFKMGLYDRDLLIIREKFKASQKQRQNNEV